MVRLLILFLFISLSAPAQKTKPLTLKFVNARIDSLVTELRWEVLNLKYEIDVLHKKIEIIKVTKDTYRLDTIRDPEGNLTFKWSFKNARYRSTF